MSENKQSSFVISGTFGDVSRDDVKQFIIDNGGRVVSALSGKTNYLVAGDDAGPAKLQKAQELGVQVISFDELKSMFCSDSGAPEKKQSDAYPNINPVEWYSYDLKIYIGTYGTYEVFKVEDMVKTADAVENDGYQGLIETAESYELYYDFVVDRLVFTNKETEDEIVYELKGDEFKGKTTEGAPVDITGPWGMIEEGGHGLVVSTEVEAEGVPDLSKFSLVRTPIVLQGKCIAAGLELYYDGDSLVSSIDAGDPSYDEVTLGFDLSDVGDQKAVVCGSTSGQAALGIFHAFMDMYPETTFDNLKDAFPDTMGGGKKKLDIFFDVDECEQISRTDDGIESDLKVFKKNGELIKTADDHSLTIASSWKTTDFDALVKKASEFNIEAEVDKEKLDKGEKVKVEIIDSNGSRQLFLDVQEFKISSKKEIPKNILTKKLRFSVILEGVTQIGYDAFNGCTSLTNVTIPKSVTKIGNNAFNGCTGLPSVSIPDSVTTIGKSAFDGCSSLTNITIPASVTEIGELAFNGCTSLTSLSISEGVTQIGYAAFIGCTSVTSITVAEGNTEYDSRSNCNAIIETKNNKLVLGCKNTVIPDGVAQIGFAAFAGCTSLTSISIPEGVTEIGDFAFNGCTSLTSVSIPESVTSIGKSVFSNCTRLTSISIPASVTSIGESVFSNCTSLTSISIPESVTSIGKSVFSNCTSLTSISIPASVAVIGNEVFRGCTSLSSLSISDGVAQIGYAAFSNCTSLTSISIPGSVASIGDSVFSNCTSLTSISISEGVTAIGGSAFSDCSSLTSLSIPTSVKSVGRDVFDGTPLLDNSIVNGLCCIDGKVVVGVVDRKILSVSIPNGVTVIAPNAFYMFDSLTSVTIPDGVAQIGSAAFLACNSLTSISIPEGVTEIGDSAFRYCSSLTSISIPASVTRIGENAFDSTGLLKNSIVNGLYCLDGKVVIGVVDKNVSSIIIPDGVHLICDGAFRGCESLSNVSVPASVSVIDRDAFACCFRLASISIPEGVTEIKSGAFIRCESFTSVTIPEGVTKIGYQAFRGCISLTSISIPESVTEIDDEAFYGCTSLTSVTILNKDCKFNDSGWSRSFPEKTEVKIG